MKRIFFVLGVIIIGALIWIIVWSYQLRRAFSWTPPSTELLLTQKETNWKKQVEKNYNCDISFIGLDDSFAEDSVIYMRINYGDHSILKKELNDEIENITTKISSSFVNSSKNKRKQSHILITYSYSHNHTNDVVDNNVPNDRSCMYTIQSKSIIPVYKSLIIPKFEYFDFFEKEKESDLFSFKLGGEMKNYFEYTTQKDSLLKYFYVQHPFKFKNLDSCQLYTAKLPYKIEMNDGYIESIHSYTFFENRCISVIINYTCFPENKNLSTKDFIKKVTEISPERLKNSKKRKLDLIDLLKRNNYSLQENLHGVTVKFKIDSLKQPWKIEYETSLNEFKFFKTR